MYGELYHYNHNHDKFGRFTFSRSGVTKSRNISRYVEKQDKCYNLNKFGKDRDHNALYITGLSGSGKSNLANKIAKDKNSEIIELDNYMMRRDSDGDDYYTKVNVGFDEFLKKEVPEFSYSLTGKERVMAFDKVVKASKKYAKSLYPNKSLIVEGVQLYDSDLFGNDKDRSTFFKDTPVIVKGTSARKSELRAIKRTAFKYRDYPEATRMVRDFMFSRGNTRLSDAYKSQEEIDELKRRIEAMF